MSEQAPWWQWPRNINRSYSPWYVVAWRLPFVCLFVPLVVLASVPLVFAYGAKEARKFIGEAFR